MERTLIQFRDQHAFALFSCADLRDYSKYKKVLAAFRTHYGLNQFSFKQIDKFLWYTGKDRLA